MRERDFARRAAPEQRSAPGVSPNGVNLSNGSGDDVIPSVARDLGGCGARDAAPKQGTGSKFAGDPEANADPAALLGRRVLSQPPPRSLAEPALRSAKRDVRARDDSSGHLALSKLTALGREPGGRGRNSISSRAAAAQRVAASAAHVLTSVPIHRAGARCCRLYRRFAPHGEPRFLKIGTTTLKTL